MLKFKLKDPFIFVALIILHVCVQLQPMVEANAIIKSNHPHIDRSFKLSLSYQYTHSMFTNSFIHSLLVMVGLWYSRHLMSIQANESKTFPYRTFGCFILSYALSFVISWWLNYTRFNVVMHHFCTSWWQVLGLYSQLQCLFLRRMLLIPYWGQVNDVPEDVITFETNLLAHL